MDVVMFYIITWKVCFDTNRGCVFLMQVAWTEAVQQSGQVSDEGVVEHGWNSCTKFINRLGFNWVWSR
jgi:hypothetical protein